MGAVCACNRGSAELGEASSRDNDSKRVEEAVCAYNLGSAALAEASSRDNDNKRVEEARRARVERLERLRRECATEEEFQTARTQPIWTQLQDSSSCSSSCTPLDPSPEDLQRIHEENRLYFQNLVDTQLPVQRGGRYTFSLLHYAELPSNSNLDLFFVNFGGRLEAGQKIGGGAQAEICEAIYDGKILEWIVLKVFKGSYLLADLERTWTKHIASKLQLKSNFGSERFGFIGHGTLLEDGRFAFVLQREWGDLRKGIDLQLVKDRTHRSSPLPLSITIRILWDIAKGMSTLHSLGVIHKDLKAANCLLFLDLDITLNHINEQCNYAVCEDHNRSFKRIMEDYKKKTYIKLEECPIWERFFMDGTFNPCTVVDFESCEGVVGTGFWRAPEVLFALKNKQKGINSSQKVWTKKADVYSYAMTCYEVLTGCIPFEDHPANDYDGVIGGKRPPMPDYVDPQLQELVRRCWHCEPSKRPTFKEILGSLGRIYVDLMG